ncbi:MAG: hypothetical protein M1818_005518 [Claussenomyces sp. TS43310]|nr:MAG: hypothetical protein M1818_005518 [Claussenomyces sp. TS43310]
MTRSISCHKTIQISLCSTIIPIALSSSHLLAAVFYLAACHPVSLGLEQPVVETAHLKYASLQQLRAALSAPSEYISKEAALASTLTLCMAEIVSGGEEQNSWRTHFEGATALSFFDTGDLAQTMDSPTKKLLKQLLQSIQAVAVSCGSPELRSSRSLCEESHNATPNYIDELTGFSTSLLPVFEEIFN